MAVVIKLALSGLIILGAFLLGAEVSLSLAGMTLSTHLWRLFALIFVVVIAYWLVCRSASAILRLFTFHPDPKKGLDYLQKAFSGMLVKDQGIVVKTLGKAKKHLGDIPLISWLEGQLSLLNKDYYKARALFYKLSGMEKDTALGAYSLAQMTVRDKSDSDAVEAIKAILKVYPDAKNFASQLVGLYLKNNDPNAALEYIDKLYRANKQEIEAIIYYEKWKQNLVLDNLKKAFKLAPELAPIAIDYAKKLFQNDDKRAAKKVLLKSFEAFPFVETCETYLNLGSPENLEKIERAKNLKNAAPESWIPYYYLAKLCVRENMLQLASDYIENAYNLAQYDFIADEYANIDALLETSKSPDLSKSKSLKSYWICSECGEHSDHWTAVCPNCLNPGSYSYIEESNSKSFDLVVNK